MSRRSIFIVEDDDDIRDQVVMALTSEGYNVIQAPNGKRALEILESLPDNELPVCMILDLMMPEMDGVTLMNEIREKHFARYGAMKILVSTAKGVTSDPEKSVPEAVGRLQKPFDLDELYAIVEKHCGKS